MEPLPDSAVDGHRPVGEPVWKFTPEQVEPFLRAKACVRAVAKVRVRQPCPISAKPVWRSAAVCGAQCRFAGQTKKLAPPAGPVSEGRARWLPKGLPSPVLTLRDRRREALPRTASGSDGSPNPRPLHAMRIDPANDVRRRSSPFGERAGLAPCKRSPSVAFVLRAWNRSATEWLPRWLPDAPQARLAGFAYHPENAVPRRGSTRNRSRNSTGIRTCTSPTYGRPATTMHSRRLMPAQPHAFSSPSSAFTRATRSNAAASDATWRGRRVGEQSSDLYLLHPRILP